MSSPRVAGGRGEWERVTEEKGGDKGTEGEDLKRIWRGAENHVCDKKRKLGEKRLTSGGFKILPTLQRRASRQSDSQSSRY